jgi:hypothetical protein
MMRVLRAGTAARALYRQNCVRAKHLLLLGKNVVWTQMGLLVLDCTVELMPWSSVDHNMH